MNGVYKTLSAALHLETQNYSKDKICMLVICIFWKLCSIHIRLELVLLIFLLLFRTSDAPSTCSMSLKITNALFFLLKSPAL